MSKVSCKIDSALSHHLADADEVSITMSVRHAIALNGLLGCITVADTDGAPDAERLLGEITESLTGVPWCMGTTDVVKQREDGQIALTGAFEDILEESAEHYHDRQRDY